MTYRNGREKGGRFRFIARLFRCDVKLCRTGRSLVWPCTLFTGTYKRESSHLQPQTTSDPQLGKILEMAKNAIVNLILFSC